MGLFGLSKNELDQRHIQFEQDILESIGKTMDEVVLRIDELLDRVNVLITPLGEANAALAATLTTERKLAKELHDDPQHAALLAAREATDEAMKIQADIVGEIRKMRVNEV